MEFHTLKCPHCGGQLDVEDGLTVMFCKYCGAKLQIDGLSDGMLNAKVRIREMDHEERMEDKKYDYKRFKILQNIKKEKWDAISIPLLILLMVFIPVIAFAPMTCSHQSKVDELNRIENEIIEDIDEGRYDEALVLCNKLRLDDHYSKEGTEAWDEKREAYIDLINKRIAEEKAKENGTSVEEELKKSENAEEKPWWQFW